ncbi:hypothetical protein EON83_19575 [bacterium]|nr:MAG: hypothetical protein EON83_19575 [bacterium]
MKNSLAAMGVVGALVTVIGSALAQPPQLPEPLWEQNFENDGGTWIAMGETAKTSIERIPDNVKEGAGSLRFDYQIANGEGNILISPLAPRSLDTLATMSFWIKCNQNASFIFALQEQGGGRFGTAFSVIKDQWQKVIITPEELSLQIGKNDPKDADGKLNTEKIEGVALVDFGQFFAQMATNAQNPLAKALDFKAGTRTVFLDGLKFSSKPPSPPLADAAFLDKFKQPQLAWIGVGDVALKTYRTEDPPSDELQADYTQTAGHAVAFAKLLPANALTGKEDLWFNILSKQPATIVVQLEEQNGGKYNMVFPVSAGTTPVLKTLTFADFKPSDDSKDDNHQLDLNQVKQILILDASGILGAGAGANTLRIGPLSVK